MTPTMGTGGRPMPKGGARIGAGRPSLYGRPMKKVQVLIPEDLHQRAKEKARMEGKSLSEVIREILSSTYK